MNAQLGVNVFFFQAEDGIRDTSVTGVQTCALPISEKMAALRVGDPFDEATELGPLSTAQGLEDLDRDVKASVDAGAKVLTGGKPMDRQIGRASCRERGEEREVGRV